MRLCLDSRSIALLCGLSVSALTFAGPPQVTDACARPLEDYCKKSPCLSYEESLAELQRLSTSQPPCYYVAVSGSCGAFRFTAIGSGFGGVTHYFDANGNLVAVTTLTDAIVGGPCSAFTTHYGKRFSCEIRTEQEYCRGK